MEGSPVFYRMIVVSVMKKASGKKAGRSALEFFQRGFRNQHGTDEKQNTGRGQRAGRKKKIARVASVLACIVAFTTTYALILPAVTLENQPNCGQEEHIHTEACYAYLDANGAVVDPAEATALLAAGDSGTDAESTEMTLLSGSRGGYSESIESNVKTEKDADGSAEDGRTEDQTGDASTGASGETGTESVANIMSDSTMVTDTAGSKAEVRTNRTAAGAADDAKAAKASTVQTGSADDVTQDPPASVDGNGSPAGVRTNDTHAGVADAASEAGAVIEANTADAANTESGDVSMADPVDKAVADVSGNENPDTVDSQTADQTETTGSDASSRKHSDATDNPATDTIPADNLETATTAPAADTSQLLRRVLICGKEEHRHSVGCYPSRSGTSSSDSTKKTSPKSVLTGLVGYDRSQSVTVDGTTITAEYNEGVLPDGVTMQAIPVSADAYVGAVADAVGKENTGIKAFDITFFNGEQEIEPSGEVKITFQADFIDPASDPAIVHITDDGSADLMDTKIANDTITLKTDSFSVYAISYTVDFHWDVDGKTYDFSILGGGFVSLTDLVEVLGIAESDGSVSSDVTLDAESAENDSGKDTAEVQEAADADAAVKRSDVAIREAAKKFVAEIESVEFSDPELLSVSKVEEDTTAGAIKDAPGLVCEYSAELTEEQIAEINAQTVEAGDWALISRKAFDTEESLTVTMKDGEQFVVSVTDAQIRKDFITAKGETYTITVISDEDAEIPDNADLKVREVEAGTSEYTKYLNDSAEELGLENADEVSFARFFDIEIVDKNGKKIEPKDSVQVKIAYKEAVELGFDDSLNVVHFGDNRTETITDLSLSSDAKEITYEQSSFSVTGTVVTPQNNNNYMLLIKGAVVEGKNVYYIVNNDGTLSPVATEWNANGTLKAVHVTEPMAWEYRNNHLYHKYDAMAYNSNHAASEFVYRYLNPAVDSGLTTETAADVTLGTYNMWTQLYENSQRRLWNSTGISYNAQNHRLSNGGSYLGVTTDEDGNLRIAGNKSASDAAEIYFASPVVVAPTVANNAVNHIDISVKGTSEIEIPLAFGDYYDENGNKILIVSKDAQKKVAVESPVVIDVNDMKRAVISAYQIDTDGTVLPLDDAFYISGFSQNDPSGIGSAGDARQIRMEGSFLASKSIHGENIDQFDNATQTYKNRLDDRVYYTVSVTKPVTFVLKDGDTILYDADRHELTITLDITMTASFDYWDIRNECPPLRLEQRGFEMVVDENGQNYKNWRQGGYTNWTGDMTGMDFQLGGDAEDANSNIVAVEITKMIMDQDGNLIKPAEQIPQTFEIWGSSTDDHKNVITTDVPEYKGDNDNYDRSSYSYLHSKEMKIGTSGMGLVYDYEITPGMYYIREVPGEIKPEIEDLDGTVWQYKETRIETEFVWRNDDTSGRHESATYTDRTTTDSSKYISVPEVAGNYTGKHYHNAGGYAESADYNSSVFYGWNEEHQQMEDDQQFRNGFLEFFVYNVYKKVESKTDITLKKVDKNDVNRNDPDYLKGASFTLSKFKTDTFQVKDTEWGDLGSKTLSDSKNQDETYTLNGIFNFEGLEEGYYKIEETGFPSGYVKLSSDPTFKVELDSSKKMEITLLNNPDNLLRLEDDKLTIVVGNQPGVALPSTGGSGTRRIYLFGSILTGFACAGLVWIRRKKRNTI